MEKLEMEPIECPEEKTTSTIERVGYIYKKEGAE